MSNSDFNLYYSEAFIAKSGELPPHKAEPRSEEAISADKQVILGPITAFIHKMNALIGEVCDSERVKGTREDLVVRLVVGGLSFTLANFFVLISKEMQSKITQREYEESFLDMFRLAVADIAKKNS